MKKIDYKILCQDVSNPPNEIKKTQEREETTMVLSDKKAETWTPYSPKPAQNNCHALKLTKQY